MYYGDDLSIVTHSLKAPVHSLICHINLNLNIGQLMILGGERVGSSLRYQLSIVIMSANYNP